MSSMKSFLAASVLLTFAGTAAADNAASDKADMFTFTSTATVENSVMFPEENEQPQGATFMSGNADVNWSSGKKSSNTFKCAQWSSAPGMGLFNLFSVCTMTDTNGDMPRTAAGCVWGNKEMTETTCYGGLVNDVGPHKGKYGSVTWHTKVSPDGKTVTAWGTGQWNL